MNMKFFVGLLFAGMATTSAFAQSTALKSQLDESYKIASCYVAKGDMASAVGVCDQVDGLLQTNKTTDPRFTELRQKATASGAVKGDRNVINKIASAKSQLDGLVKDVAASNAKGDYKTSLSNIKKAEEIASSNCIEESRFVSPKADATKLKNIADAKAQVDYLVMTAQANIKKGDYKAAKANLAQADAIMKPYSMTDARVENIRTEVKSK